jgi:hypothetical protein
MIESFAPTVPVGGRVNFSEWDYHYHDSMPRPNWLGVVFLETAMQTTKQEVASLLERLPEGSSLEDVQYHLYVIEKVRSGLARAEVEGTVSQAQAEEHLGKWLTKS